MNCNQCEDHILDLASGASPSAEVARHLRECPACATKLDELRATMAMLDEWKIPEPSPYFDTRLKARMREERAKAPVGLLGWLRRPALGLALAGLMAVGVALYTAQPNQPAQQPQTAQTTTSAQPQAEMVQVAEATTTDDGPSFPVPLDPKPGTAVSDLQTLDSNEELFASFDVLDELGAQEEQTEANY